MKQSLRDWGDGALCCAHVPRRIAGRRGIGEPVRSVALMSPGESLKALASSFTSLHRTPHRPDPAPELVGALMGSLLLVGDNLCDDLRRRIENYLRIDGPHARSRQLR